MKILFIIFDHLLSNQSHIVRLNMSLNYMSQHNDISILCLTNKRYISQEKKYKNVKFYYHPITYNWREVKNIEDILCFLKKIKKEFEFDIIVQMMEIWDLVREISLHTEKGRFSAVFHAMPFLGTPQNFSKNFYRDVQQYCINEPKSYRKNYVKDHYKEFYKVMDRIGVIAANPTVAYYLHNYYKNLNISTLEPCRLSPIWYNVLERNDKIYDFVYMARIEKWKGIDYLEKILIRIANILNKKIRVAIIGNIEDFYSFSILEKIKHNENIDVSYFGWCWNKEKKQILSKSKIFLYPSIYDTYSITLAEAVSIGLPCIVRDVIYTKLNYDKVSYVYRIPFGNYKNFAEKAITLLKNKLSIQKGELVQTESRKSYFDRIGKSDLYSYINSCEYGKHHRL